MGGRSAPYRMSFTALSNSYPSIVSAYCARPVFVEREDGSPGFYVRCGSRLRSVCEACSKVFAGDWSAIFRSGLFNCDVASYKWQFLTLTAPSFGKVHSVGKDSPLAGVPVDMDSYAYDAAVRWNYHVGSLWDRTRLRLRRAMPGMDFALVREWQARGSVHMHALIRVPIESGLTDSEVARISQKTTAVVRDFNAASSFKMVWGPQVKALTIKPEGTGAAEAAKQVWYLCKALGYSAKSFGEGFGDARIAASRLHAANLARAASRMVCQKCAETPLRLFGRCSARCHRNYGAKNHLVSVSRRTEERSGWSFIHLTRAKQRSERAEWAAANALPNQPSSDRAALGVLAARAVALAARRVPDHCAPSRPAQRSDREPAAEAAILRLEGTTSDERERASSPSAGQLGITQLYRSRRLREAYC